MSTKGYRAARLLGALSSVATVLAVLALQDIYHAETDLTLEWSVMRICFLIIIAFHAVALFALSNVISAPD